MEDVRFYDFEFNLLHIEHDIISCNWTLYENEVGSFEMHVPLVSKLVSVMMENRYLVAVQGTKQAIITGRQLGTEAVLYGRTCNWILSRFCLPEIFDTDSLQAAGTIGAKDAQTVCRYIISRSMGQIESFVFTENTEADFGEVFLENKSISAALDLVTDCVRQAGCGHEVIYDIANKKWRFRLFQGVMLPGVLSEANRNCYDTVYTEDLQSYFPGGWYEQKTGEGETAFVQLASGLRGIYAWETALSGETGQEAKKDLDTRTIERQTELKTKGLLFGRDYGLNDSLRTQIKKGDFSSGMTRRITGVHLWYEKDDVGEQPILAEQEG